MWRASVLSAVHYPKTVLKGIGQTAVRCAACGADASPFTFTNGYTIAFDPNRSVGVTLDQAAAEQIAHNARQYAALPENSIQNPILTFAPHDLVGLVARLRPFMGQLGTTPRFLPRLAQRRRLRLLPDRRAARIRDDRRPACASH